MKTFTIKCLTLYTKYIIIIYIIHIVYIYNTNRAELLTMNKNFFLKPTTPMQKRYEALRASFLDELSAKDIAKKYGFSIHTINALRRDFKSDSLSPFFQTLKRGPKQPHSSTLHIKGRIIELRKQNYSIIEIQEVLMREGATITPKTIHKILKTEGFAKLFRRTHVERRIALQNAKNPAEVTDVNDFGLHDFVTTAYGGVFLFIPFILDLKLNTLFEHIGFYGS